MIEIGQAIKIQIEASTWRVQAGVIASGESPGRRKRDTAALGCGVGILSLGREDAAELLDVLAIPPVLDALQHCGEGNGVDGRGVGTALEDTDVCGKWLRHHACTSSPWMSWRIAARLSLDSVGHAVMTACRPACTSGAHVACGRPWSECGMAADLSSLNWLNSQSGEKEKTCT
jgi:hypothetical protein